MPHDIKKIDTGKIVDESGHRLAVMLNQLFDEAGKKVRHNIALHGIPTAIQAGAGG